MKTSDLSEFDLYLFHQGTNFHAYEMLGAHFAEQDGKKGVRFAVWAPHAKSVSVVGDFNDWDTRCYKMKKIVVNPGAKLSLQLHYHRSEHWTVISGTGKTIINDKESIFTENQSTYIPMGVKHKLSNPGKIPLIIIEVQSGKYIDDNDIVVFE